MSTRTATSRLLELLLRYEELGDAAPGPEAFCSDCPELLPAFRDALRQLGRFRRFFEPTQADATPPEPLAPDVPGYDLGERLGAGGMGVVYKAVQRRGRRVVALKMIRGEADADGPALARFQTEAEAVARLAHPNIVAIHEIGEHAGQPFFSMEFCPGGSLAQRLARESLPPAEAARLVQAVALGMQAAHEARVIHRDLKPANILLAADGTPKIADFGLARKLDDVARTATGAVLGTPSYMAPEQAQGRIHEVGPAADVYALGAILYECLTGRPPFKAATMMETLLQVIHNEPVAVRLLNPAVPRDLETIVHKCLQKEPGQRYASARDLADDLGRFLDGRPVQARPVGWLERGWRWCRRNQVVATLLAAVWLTLAAGVAASTYFWRDAVRQAETANNNATRAETRKAEAVRATERWQSAVARGLLSPLGGNQPSLNPAEVRALWELCRYRNTDLAPRFATEAIREPTTARQLRLRAVEALHAAVGLDLGKRREVEAVLQARLADGDLTAEHELDVVLAGVALGGGSPELNDRLAQGLLRSLLRAGAYDVMQERAATLGLVTRRMPAKQAIPLLVQALPAAREKAFALPLVARLLVADADRLEPAEAREVADALLGLVPTVTDGNVKQSLSQDLREVVRRLPPSEATALLLPALADERYRFIETELASALAATAAALGPAEAQALCRQVVDHLQQGLQPGQVDHAWVRDRYLALESLLPYLEAAEAQALRSRSAACLAGSQGWVSENADFSSREESHRLLARLAEHLEPADADRAGLPLALGLARTRDARAGSGLAPLLTLVAGRMGPEAVEKAAEALREGLIGETQPPLVAALAEPLSLLCRRLPRKEAEAVCWSAAARIRALARTTPPHFVAVFLSRALAAVGPHLEGAAAEEAAVALADPLLDAYSRTFGPVARPTPPRPGEPPTPPPVILRDMIAQGLRWLAPYLGDKELRRILGRATTETLTALERATFPDERRRLAQQVVRLAAPLEPAQAADSLTRAWRQAHGPEQEDLAVGLAALAPRLEAGLAAATVTEFLGEKTGTEASAVLARIVVTVLPRMSPAEARRLATLALGRLAPALRWAPKPPLLDEVLTTLQDLLPHADPQEATAALLALGASENPGTLRHLESLWPALVSHLGPAEAATVADRLLQALAGAAERWRRDAFALALPTVAARMEPAAARALCRRAIATPAGPNSAPNPAEWAVIGGRLAAHLDADEARQVCAPLAEALVRQLPGETNPYQQGALAQGLAALAPYLSPDEVRSRTTELAQLLVRATEHPAIAGVAPGIAALAARGDAEQAGRLAALLIDARARAGSFGSVDAATEALAAVLGRESPGRLARRRVAVARLVGRMALPTGGPAVLGDAAEPLPPPLPVRTLVELLKHPLCVGEPRRLVLLQLERHYGRPFADQWEFVHFAREEKLGLDLTTPPGDRPPSAVR